MLDEIQKADKEWAEKTGKEVEKERPGLRFRPYLEDGIRAAASAFGTLHDSRAGKGFLYRYSPRSVEDKIEGKVEKVHDVTVHHTALRRMLHGSDNYVPFVLPPSTQVLRADGMSEPLPDYINRWMQPAADKETYERNRDRLLDKVWLRQGGYFSMLAALLALLFLPLWQTFIPEVSNRLTRIPAQVLFGPLAGALKMVMPSYIGPYLDAVRYHPLVVIPLIILAWVFYKWGNGLRQQIRDRARDVWKPSPGPPQTRFRIVRYMRDLRSWLNKQTKYLGSLAVAVGLVVVLVAITIGVSRLAFNFRMGIGWVCQETDPLQQWLGSDGLITAAERFETSNPCWASKVGVEKGIAYRLLIDIDRDDPWFDGPIMTDVGGFENDGLPWKILRWPLLRWPSAGWFQPIARIGADGDVEWPITANDGSGPIPADPGGCTQMPKSYLLTDEFCRAHDEPIPCDNARKEMEREMGQSWLDFAIGGSKPLPPQVVANASDAWRQTQGARRNSRAKCSSSYPRMTLVSDFVAQKTGELFLFVNDAMPGFFKPAADTHYMNNRGSATITLSRAPLADSKVFTSQRQP